MTRHGLSTLTKRRHLPKASFLDCKWMVLVAIEMMPTLLLVASLGDVWKHRRSPTDSCNANMVLSVVTESNTHGQPGSLCPAQICAKARGLPTSFRSLPGIWL